MDTLLGSQLGFPLVAGETTELDLVSRGPRSRSSCAWSRRSGREQRALALNIDLPAQPLSLTTGAVTLQDEAVPGGVRFLISDTGIGISPEDLPHIFEPFWQADRTQRARGEGSGLGL